MEQAYIIARLKEMTTPEILDAISEAKYGQPVDIYTNLDPELIDRVTDAIADFVEAVQKIDTIDNR